MTGTAPTPAPAPDPRGTYDAATLTYLEGLDAVRKRPGMYIGSTDGRGLTHLVRELVDNAVDEALAGHATTVEITGHPDGSIEVADDGRGIPVDPEPTTGLPGVRLVFEKLHAGGKFGGSGYKVAGGLHGVGASVVNALSVRLDVEVRRDGRRHQVQFCRGQAGRFAGPGPDAAFVADPAVRDVGATRSHGTTVRFWADRSFFLADAAVDWDAVLERARQIAFLVPALTVAVTPPGGARQVLRFDGGIADFAEFLADDPALVPVVRAVGTGTFTETVPVLDGGELVSREVVREVDVDVAVRFGAGFDTTLRSFVNVVETPKGGTHLSGFERALVRATNEALRAHKVLRANEEAATKDDCLEGVTAVVAVRLAEPQFEGQTKEVLGTAQVAGVVQRVVADALGGFYARRTRTTRAVLDKVAAAVRTRVSLRERRETIRRKNALESSSLPAKLVECASNDTARTELLLVEGDSALGTVKMARDSEFQAVLPLRGKILNTYRASERQMLENAECAAIIAALGAGSGRSFDLDACRYQRVLLLTDADVDGSHIRCLLITLFYRYLRPFLAAGRLFSATPPLHRLSVRGRPAPIYTYSDDENRRVLAELAAAGETVTEDQRYKGLGEMDADQLAETTMDVATRQLRRIGLGDAALASALFDVLMGNDAAARRAYITDHTHLVDPVRLDV